MHSNYNISSHACLKCVIHPHNTCIYMFMYTIDIAVIYYMIYTLLIQHDPTLSMLRNCKRSTASAFQTLSSSTVGRGRAGEFLEADQTSRELEVLCRKRLCKRETPNLCKFV